MTRRGKAAGKRAVLEALALDLSVERVLDEHPDWTTKDIRALLSEAARSYPVDGAAGAAGGVVAFVDGASRGNPGEAGCGVVFKDAEGATLAELSRPLGEATNNVAEYEAFITAVEEAVRRGWLDLKVFADSELMVRQLTGVYRVRNPGLKDLYDKALSLCRALERWSIEHVGRGGNVRADELANHAIEEALKGRR
ncbi:MAG: reverse transcriptase-like protein [bacterium]